MGAKKQRPWLGLNALQNFWGAKFPDHIHRIPIQHFSVTSVEMILNRKLMRKMT